MSNAETCPACEGRGPAYTIACSVNEAGGGKCRESLSACDFCGGLGIVEIAVADRYRKGQELRNLRVKRIRATQEQLARILRIPGVPNGEAVHEIEHGRGPIPER